MSKHEMTSSKSSKIALTIYLVLFVMWCLALGLCPEFSIPLALCAVVPIWKGPRMYRIAGVVMLLLAISGGIAEYKAIQAQTRRSNEIVPVYETLQDADIIFHSSRSAQGNAIQKATGSPYTHMGIIFIERTTPFVFEAVGPVKKTPEYSQRTSSSV